MEDYYKIRKIQIKDNQHIANVKSEVLTEFVGNRPGTAYYDHDTDYMFEAYKGDNEIYYVVLIDDKIVGGCGIKSLKGNEPEICELQKLYLISSTQLGTNCVHWYLKTSLHRQKFWFKI
jgi:putative acetyltransferase